MRNTSRPLLLRSSFRLTHVVLVLRKGSGITVRRIVGASDLNYRLVSSRIPAAQIHQASIGGSVNTTR